MLNRVIEKLCAKDYVLTFEKSNAQTLVTAKWQDEYGQWQERSQVNQNCFYGLYDLLEEIGEPELVSQAASELASLGTGKPGARSETSAKNGRKGGRPKGSKDSYQRVRSR